MKIEDEIKQPKFKDPFQKAVINLIFTANWLQHKHQGFFKAAGITIQQFNILRILKGQYPKSISATEIKSRMLDKNSDVSRLLDRLVAKNLVTRQVCPNDKRAGLVSALLRAKLVMGPHQEREFRVLDRIEACLRAAVQGRGGELSGFLPPPDEGGRTGVLGMLPHVNAITGLIGRVNQHAALHPGIHIVHDQQLQFAPAIQAAVEQLQAISDRVVEATACTKASEVEDWSVAGRVSLEFSDSRACRGIQAADVIARFCMQRMTAILSGAETDPFQAEPLVLLRDLRTRKPEVGVRIVASTRDANRFWES